MQFPNAQLSAPIPGNEDLRFLNFRGGALPERADVLIYLAPEAEKLVRGFLTDCSEEKTPMRE